jgi:hypothetical protein
MLQNLGEMEVCIELLDDVEEYTITGREHNEHKDLQITYFRFVHAFHTKPYPPPQPNTCLFSHQM